MKRKESKKLESSVTKTVNWMTKYDLTAKSKSKGGRMSTDFDNTYTSSRRPIKVRPDEYCKECSLFIPLEERLRLQRNFTVEQRGFHEKCLPQKK